MRLGGRRNGHPRIHVNRGGGRQRRIFLVAIRHHSARMQGLGVALLLLEAVATVLAGLDVTVCTTPIKILGVRPTWKGY